MLHAVYYERTLTQLRIYTDYIDHLLPSERKHLKLKMNGIPEYSSYKFISAELEIRALLHATCYITDAAEYENSFRQRRRTKTVSIILRCICVAVSCSARIPVSATTVLQGYYSH